MVRRLASILAGALFAVLPIAALAQLTPGTTLVGTFDANLSSNHVAGRSAVHDFQRPLDELRHQWCHDLRHVAAVQSAGQGRPGKITLAYDKVNTRSAASIRSAATHRTSI